MQLPTGTVTLLFTDIEGSTRLVARLRDRYAEVLSDHQQLLREAFTEHDGQEIETQGDSFFAAFSRAKDAVEAAVAAQRSLATYEWPDGIELRVRMGVHTGEPSIGTDRYVGLGVHRAARIAAAAHGGQVLVSAVTRGLVEDELPEGVGLCDVGEHVLKDLDRPERLSQLAIDGLPAEFPPLRTAGEVALDVSGREQELEESAEEAVEAAAHARRRRRRLLGTALGVALAAGIAATVAIVLAVLPGVERGQPPPSEVAPNSVGVLDPESAKLVAQVPVGDNPKGVVAARDGVWVANTGDATVSRIDPATRVVVRTIPLAGKPSDVAARHAVWVLHDRPGSTVDPFAGDAAVSEIDPDFNSVAETIDIPAGFGNGFSDPIAVGANSV